jgi:exodeoxyribonuclease V alpha subunit
MIVGMPTGTPVHRDPSVLEGVLERIIFANPGTGYTIARIDSGRGGPDLITVVEPLLGGQVGESLRMRGRWTSHPKYGKQCCKPLSRAFSVTWARARSRASAR